MILNLKFVIINHILILVNLKELLSKGEHNLSFAIATYDVKNQTACNGATQDVTVTVK